MKRERRYGADGGCLMIGNGSCRFKIQNGIGDGEHRLTVLDTEEPCPDYNDWEWLGTVEGDAINVYEYDCISPEELPKSVLLTLRGRYSIYRSREETGHMVLQGGEDA
ncbi:MAG: hypothetical protein J6Y20_14810 [Lachnospiraceae bacterium]|nr:hypothetical protein [Lachnospiraceae bacterium]